MAVKGINGADLNNISKVDGRSNVLDKVNGIDADLAPPAAAYSVRNVSGLTGIPYDGPAMRILVDATGDGADATDLEFDINFTADGDLDVADIELKCAGGKDAYVVKWYDQSGAGNDATQTAYADMPKIATAGVVILENGQPTILFDEPSGSVKGFPLTIPSLTEGEMFTAVRWLGDTGTRGGWKISTNGFDMHFPYYGGLVYDNFGSTSRYAFTPSITLNQLNLYNTVSTSSEWTARLNGDVERTSATNTVGFANGILGASTGMNHHFSEWILFASAKSTAERTDIENNINSYFNIYQSRENILPGAAAAYSLRQLSDSSRLAIRVRRDTGVGSGTDDDEADVGFDANGELSLASPVSNFDPTGSAATTLGGFLGHGGIYGDPDSLGAPADGFVTAWYDQSANANNATQITPGAQPKIYDSSTGLITENGKPAVYFTDKNKQLVSNLGANSIVTCDFVAVNRRASGTGYPYFWYQSLFQVTEYFSTSYYLGWNRVIGPSSDTSQHLDYHVASNGTGFIRRDGTSYSSGTLDTTRHFSGLFAMQGRPNFVGVYNAPEIYQQEFVIWNSNQSAGNRTDIEGNINAHYGIANFGTPSSGLLADYPGSAAAYSVRKLADTASLAMRIIVDDTAVIGTVDASDTEYDIGFDANGDLDVARIREVCNNPSGANYNAYVVTWYDQSGNGNHATQATYTSCPQIYDGVDVIMENGKPALDFDGSDDQLNLTGFTNAASDYSCAIVNTNTASNSFNFDSQSGRLIIDGRGASKGAYYDGAWKGSSHSGTAQSLNTFFLVSPSSGETYKNGTAVNTGLTYTQKAIGGTVTLGADYGSPTTAVNGPYQEFILWDSDKSSNRKAIETDIDSYYRIYGDPDDGLLSTPYGKGAAAAYSVRRLSNNATRAMRIVVDADANGPDASDNEYDIGFDANGELDIARIEELCDKGTGNYDAYVTTWYDQSGEGNDATQATHASMPKICDAGTVITENGKPALQYDGTNDFFELSSLSISASNGMTVSFVSAATGTGTEIMFNVRADASAGNQIFYATSTNRTSINGRSSSGSYIGVNAPSTGIKNLVVGLWDWQNDNLYSDFDGDAATSASGLTEAVTTIDRIRIGQDSGVNYAQFNLNECIIWPVNTITIGDLADDTNTYYSIY